MRREAELEPAVIFKRNDSTITKRELQLLRAMGNHRSQNQAAKSLGISVPVLNKTLKALEEKCEKELIITSPLSTTLTKDAEELLEMERRFDFRLSAGSLAKGLVIGATPVYEDRVRKILKKNDTCLVADDTLNLKMFQRGELDILLLDDPDHLLDLSASEHSPLVGRIFELATDKLIHFDAGNDYIEFGYGAQRIGYRFLKARGKEPNIVETTRDIETLVNSKKSFFLNQSLIDLFESQNRGLNIPKENNDIVLEFTLNAVIIRDDSRTQRDNAVIEEFLKYSKHLSEKLWFEFTQYL